MEPTPGTRSLLESACRSFRSVFGNDPRWAAAAPGRVNLIGEHTDYSGGFVLPIALDRVTVAVGAPAADPAVTRLHSDQMGDTRTLDLRRPLTTSAVARGSWHAYPAGVLAGFQLFKDRPEIGNLDILFASSVPVGSGLSSSAAIEVATATMLEGATGRRLDGVAKALLCQRAEHEYAGVPCGIMDQFVSVLGREGHALLIDCRSHESTTVPVPEAAAIVIADSGVRHDLAAGEYARRRRSCESAAEKLGVGLLRVVTPVMLESGRGALSDDEYRLVRHVVTENARTLSAATALESGDLEHVGRLLSESHVSLRDDYRVSCEELDALVTAASGLPGVFGARLTGGGFGGCIVALCRPEAVGVLESALGRAGARAVFVTHPASGAHLLPL